MIHDTYLLWVCRLARERTLAGRCDVQCGAVCCAALQHGAVRCGVVVCAVCTRICGVQWCVQCPHLIRPHHAADNTTHHIPHIPSYTTLNHI